LAEMDQRDCSHTQETGNAEACRLPGARRTSTAAAAMLSALVTSRRSGRRSPEAACRRSSPSTVRRTPAKTEKPCRASSRATLRSLCSRRHEALEFLEPVLDEDHFGHGLGLPLFHLHHQEPLAVGTQIPASDGRSMRLSPLLKKKACPSLGESPLPSRYPQSTPDRKDPASPQALGSSAATAASPCIPGR